MILKDNCGRFSISYHDWIACDHAVLNAKNVLESLVVHLFPELWAAKDAPYTHTAISYKLAINYTHAKIGV